MKNNGYVYSVRESSAGPWHTARLDGWGYSTLCDDWFDYATLEDIQDGPNHEPQCAKCKAESEKANSDLA